MLVLVLFLGDWRAALIVATSMPLSVFAALVLMACFGMTINIMSLGGLVVGIGMMVDNSIVVLDSCFRARDGVRSFEESAIQGANLVNSAVIASTLTTIVVFLPISADGRHVRPALQGGWLHHRLLDDRFAYFGAHHGAAPVRTDEAGRKGTFLRQHTAASARAGLRNIPWACAQPQDRRYHRRDRIAREHGCDVYPDRYGAHAIER